MQLATHQKNPEVAGMLAEALDRMLRPIIRLIVGRVSCHFLLQMLRRIYIEEARRWIARHSDNGRVTKSKLALLTGLDTRTIDSVEASPQDFDDVTTSDICAEAAVLGRWVNDPEYQDDEGAPERLAIFGRPRTFETLSKPLIGRAVTCNTVLERLLDAGNVRVVEDDFVELINPFYEPLASSEATVLEVGSWSIYRLAMTVFANLKTPEFANRLLQRDRFILDVSETDYAAARAELKSVLERHIVEIENVLERYERPTGSGGRTLGVGWYIFT